MTGRGFYAQIDELINLLQRLFAEQLPKINELLKEAKVSFISGPAPKARP